MTGTEIYKRTPEYDKKANDIRLLAPHWKVLLAYDGVKTLSEVALAADATFAEAVPLTQKFLGEGWIKEEPITLDQYLKRVGMKDISAGAPVAPAQVLHEPGNKPATVSLPELAKLTASPSPAPMPVTLPPAPVPITARPAIPPAAPALSTPPPLPAIPKLATPPATALAATANPIKPARSMKLSAIVNFITSLVGNVSLGQLLVYRVFLRVPPELLMAEDIASVHLVNDTSLVQTEKLQKAIADAVQSVTKRSLPDSVYA